MQKKYQLPPGQSWILERGKTLGYDLNAGDKPEESGICFGIAHMGVQAIFADDIETFDDRFKLIHDIPIENFALEIASARQLQKESGKVRINDPRLDIPPFFEGAHLYQNPIYNINKEWFDKENRPSHQDSVKTAPLIFPEKLKDNPLTTLTDRNFMGIYSQEDLQTYMSGLDDAVTREIQRLKSLHKTMPPLAFYLSNKEHAIAIGYRPSTGEWLLIDANELPTFRTTNPNELALQIKRSLFDNLYEHDPTQATYLGIHTKIYALSNEDDKLSLNTIISDWQSSEKWKLAHQIGNNKLPTAPAKDANTWLFLAAAEGSLLTVRQIINAGIDINTRDDQGRTPLMLAVSNGHHDIAQFLFENGADALLTDNNGLSAFQRAIKSRDQEIKKLLEDYDGRSALLVAVKKNDLELLQTMIDTNTNLNIKDIDGSTPLILSIQKNYPDILKQLVEHGADVNLANQEGATPLYFTSHYGDLDASKLLIEHGANVNAVSLTGWSVLDIAASNQNLDMATLLLKNGATLDPASSTAHDLFYFAIEQGNSSLVRLLQTQHMSPTTSFTADLSFYQDLVNNKGEPAIENLNQFILKNKLENEPSITLTAYDFAAILEQKDILRLLKTESTHVTKFGLFSTSSKSEKTPEAAPDSPKPKN